MVTAIYYTGLITWLIAGLVIAAVAARAFASMLAAVIIFSYCYYHCNARNPMTPKGFLLSIVEVWDEVFWCRSIEAAGHGWWYTVDGLNINFGTNDRTKADDEVYHYVPFTDNSPTGKDVTNE